MDLRAFDPLNCDLTAQQRIEQGGVPPKSQANHAVSDELRCFDPLSAEARDWTLGKVTTASSTPSHMWTNRENCETSEEQLDVEGMIERKVDQQIKLVTLQIQDSVKQSVVEIFSAEQRRLEATIAHLYGQIERQQLVLANLPKQPCPNCAAGIQRADVHKLDARLEKLEAISESERQSRRITVRDASSQTSVVHSPELKESLGDEIDGNLHPTLSHTNPKQVCKGEANQVRPTAWGEEPRQNNLPQGLGLAVAENVEIRSGEPSTNQSSLSRMDEGSEHCFAVVQRHSGQAEIVVKVSQGDDVRRLRVALAEGRHTAEDALAKVKMAVKQTFETGQSTGHLAQSICLQYRDNSGALCDLTASSVARFLRNGEFAAQLRLFVAPPRDV